MRADRFYLPNTVGIPTVVRDNCSGRALGSESKPDIPRARASRHPHRRRTLRRVSASAWPTHI